MVKAAMGALRDWRGQFSSVYTNGMDICVLRTYVYNIRRTCRADMTGE